MTERFRRIGNRIYDVQKAIQIANQPREVDVIAWSGNNRVSSTLDFRKAMESDVTQPILIAHNKVIDGEDRLYKALRMGSKTIPAFILSDEQAFSVMAVKTAVNRVHPDVAKEIRQKHKEKGELAHPYYALEKRKPSGKDRTCRECNNTIEGDAIFFDRATGDEPWLREKGYLCLKHEKDADIEKWIRCPRRECGESVPESGWSEHWRDHSVAASVHRFHTSKVAHCGQCEDDLELEPPVKRRVNIDGTVTAEELDKVAGDLIGPDVFEKKLRQRREEDMSEEGSRSRHPSNYRSPEETKAILTGEDKYDYDYDDEETEFYDQDDEPKPGPYDQEQELEYKSGDEPQTHIDLETGETTQWHPGFMTPKGPLKKGQVQQNIGLTNPTFPEIRGPRVDVTNQSLQDPRANSAIQTEIDQLAQNLNQLSGKPSLTAPDAKITRIPSRRSRNMRTHYHTVTDETGEDYRMVPCGEQYVPNFRLASSNTRDLAKLESLTNEWHDNTTLHHELPDDFEIRRLNTIGDHVVEGTMMNHCLNEGARSMMGEPVRNPMTGEQMSLPGAPVIPRDPDYRWTMYDLPRLFREQGKPFFSEEEQNYGGQTIPAWRYQGPLFSLRSKGNLPKATFFHPMNHQTGEMNPLVAHDIYGVNNKELHPKYRYRMYQYMLDNLNADTTGADSVTLRWGKTYEGDEQHPGVPEELLTDTEVLSRAELEGRLAEMDAQYKRNETDKVKKTRENERVAHSLGTHAHTYVDETGRNFKTVLCSFGRYTGRTSNTLVKQQAEREDLLDLYGDNTTTRHQFENGFSVHRLNTVGDYLFEGNLNRNCLRQYAQFAINEGRVPEDMSHPFELSHFPYVMGATDTDNPNKMIVNDRPWRYSGPFYSLRDENGISKATFFHPMDQNREPIMTIAHDVFGINNSALHERYRLPMYRWMLHNLDNQNKENMVTIRWGLTNPEATIETPEHLLTNTEILTRDGLMRRIGEYKNKYGIDSQEKMAHFSGWRNQIEPIDLSARALGVHPSVFTAVSVQNFWGWKNGARSKRKYRPSQCECWEGYERVPGTKPCAPGSCRKKTGPVEKESAVMLPEATVEALERGKRDQEVRLNINYDEDSANALKEVDADNLAWLKNYVKDNGFPGKSQIGEEAAQKMWLMTQHAGPEEVEFMESVHKSMTDAPEEHNPANVAMLEDRINVYRGRPQNYGTQSYSEDGGKTWTQNEVANPEGLAERRKQVGLEDYDKEEKNSKVRWKTVQAKKSEAPYGVIFHGEDKAIVGAQHETPIKLSDELTKKIQDIGEKHGYWYEGIGGDIEPNKDKFGTKKNYKGSWDDEFVNTLEPSPDYFMLFANVTVNKIIDKVTDPEKTIFDSILSGYKEDKKHKFLYYVPDVKPTSDMLTDHLKSISDDNNDFLEMSKQKATKTNTTKFLRAGEKLAWPEDGDPKAVGTTNASKVVMKLNDQRDKYLLSQEKGVYVTGAGHLPNLLAIDDSLKMVGGEEAK